VEEKGLDVNEGEMLGALDMFDEGGRVSQESVRRHDCRTMEKEVGASGSCVEV